jgi:hypothetical protein
MQEYIKFIVGWLVLMTIIAVATLLVPKFAKYIDEKREQYKKPDNQDDFKD